MIPSFTFFVFLAGPVLTAVSCFVWILSLRWAAWRCRQRYQCRSAGTSNHVTLGFFHPFCSGGGGGERVLWKMIESIVLLQDKGTIGNKKLKNREPLEIHIVVYTVDKEETDSNKYAANVLKNVQERFGIANIQHHQLQQQQRFHLHFVHLNPYKHLLDPAPRLSMIVESIGTMRLAMAALQSHLKTTPAAIPLPDYWVDTTGCAFTFWVAKVLFNCRVAAYVHYPTISTDMLHMVWQRRRTAYNHNAAIATSLWKTTLKWIYYCSFAIVYGVTGSLADYVWTNSSWTRNHIAFLWKGPAWRNRIQIIYPPCRVPDLVDTSSTAFVSASSKKEPVILSIGQFRPEKDHVLQLEAFAKLISKNSKTKIIAESQLVLVGGCRDGTGDAERLEQLQTLARELNIRDRVQFVINQPYSVVQDWLSKAKVGIHTVRDDSEKMCVLLIRGC